MKLRSRTDWIILHCSDTPNDRDVTTEDIRGWHIDRSFKDIGYHFVIERSGEIYEGRDLEATGAHCQGMNSCSIGVCLVGRDQFTWHQWHSVKVLCDVLVRDYKLALSSVRLHHEFPSAQKQGKKCPNFNKANLYWYLSTGNLQAVSDYLSESNLLIGGGKNGKGALRVTSTEGSQRSH